MSGKCVEYLVVQQSVGSVSSADVAVYFAHSSNHLILGFFIGAYSLSVEVGVGGSTRCVDLQD